MKNKIDRNFLDFVPAIPEDLPWKTEDSGLVVLEVENKGIANKIAQKLFRKPKISYIHLDEKGSNVWLKIDGERTIFQIGEIIAENSEEDENVIYGSLATFFKTLESYKFVIFN